jgi:hypothetical protein
MINAKYETLHLKHLVKKYNLKPDVVINFNYDYYFLSNEFSAPIITIINDAFWERPVLGLKFHMKSQLISTILISNRVLTVSVPLKSELSNYCEPILFRPWFHLSDNFNIRLGNNSGNVVLFWGYINRRINFEYIARLKKEYVFHYGDVTFRFVGPIESDVDKIFFELVEFGVIEHREPCGLQQLSFDNVFANIIPYKDSYCENVTDFPNKLLPLVSSGIPVFYSGMPNMIEAPFIFSLCSDPIVDVRKIYEVRNNTLSGYYIKDIEEFIFNNNDIKRYKQFMSICEDLTNINSCE